MIRIFTYILMSFLFAMLFSCNVINPDEKIPAYIRIEKIELETNPTTEGSNSAKIADAWIYVNDQTIGTFELPCLVPVLHSGNSVVSIQAGIKVNGISALRFPYPFFRFSTTEVNLVEDSIISITPKVAYYPDVNFAYRANFDDPSGITLEPTSDSDTSIKVINDPSLVFEGNGSAYAILTRDSTFMNFQSTVVMDLPKNGRTVYLEMDYKVNGLLDVGLITVSPTNTFRRSSLTLNPTTEWNKVYVNLTENVSLTPNAIGYRLLFRAYKLPGDPNVELFLDNLKVVYLN